MIGQLVVVEQEMDSETLRHQDRGCEADSVTGHGNGTCRTDV